MAKKKNQTSKRPRTNSKENIQSSSLLPARSHGERPDMAFSVKREPIENDDSVAMENLPINNPEIAALFAGIADAKNRTVESEGSNSNHSAVSTCTEPMDIGEENANDLYTPNTENHVVPTCFPQVLVKQEMRMPEVPSNQAGCSTALNADNIIDSIQSNVKESLSNNYVENSSENNVVTPTTSDQLKKEAFENNENCQDTSIQNLSYAPINIKTEPTEKHENAAEIESNNTEKLPVKRKPHLDAKLEQLRKRMKKEPCEDIINENETRNFSFEQNNETQQEDTSIVPLSKINGISDQVREERTGDNERTEDTVKEEIIDHDIAVLTMPKIEKNIETITLSDDDDPHISEEQDIEMKCGDIENTFLSTNNNIPDVHSSVPAHDSAELLTSQPSTSASQKKVIKERNFSLDILNYFSVVTELDRYDCQTCLDSLQKRKVNNNFQRNNPFNNFVPVFKKEEKSKDGLQKGDILFKKITKTSSEKKETSISQNDNSILQNLPAQSTAQSVTERIPKLLSSSLFPAEASQNLDYNISEHFPRHTAVDFTSLPTSQSSIFSPNSFPTSTSSNFKINPSSSSWSATSLPSNSKTGENIISRDELQDILSKLPNFLSHNTNKKGTTNDQHFIGNSSKVTAVISPRVSSPQAPLDSGACETITPLLNRTFQMPSYSGTTTFAAAASSHSVPTTTYFPAVPGTSAISSHPQETHDSHHAINQPVFLPNSKTGSNIQNRNIAVVQHQVSFQPVTTLPTNNFQSLPGHSASLNSLRPASSLSLGSRDPRTAANRVTRTEFPPRKGQKNLSLYLNIGKDYITQHFDELILQWNPDWMRIQQKNNILPPISETYKPVVYFYSNEMDYYNTYVPLHLLQIWHNIFQYWMRRSYPVVPKCKVQSVERIDNGFKISLIAVLRNTVVLPKNDDIVWCMHDKEEAFLRVEDVKRKPLEDGLKLRMTLHTLHNLQLNLDDEVSLGILYNTRAAYLQTEALNSLDNTMKELVLKPAEFLNRIEIVQLNSSQRIKDQRNDILKVVTLPQIRVTVVETYYNHDNVLLLTHVAYNILLAFNVLFSEKYKNSKSQTTARRQSKVLIILKNDQLLEKLYRSLSQYEPILAVRTKQINLSPELIKYTVEDYLEKSTTEEHLERKDCFNKILQEHHIFLTTVSALGSTEKILFSKMRDLICIIDDAHLCTEVETALPLTLKISKLLLIGNKDRSPSLPSPLVDYKYHITFFLRLLKAKRRL